MAAAYNGPRSPHIAVIAALAVETACLGYDLWPARGGRIGLRQSGPGAERALAGAREMLAGGAAGLIAWGFSGALVPGLAAGTVLLPARVRSSGGRVLATDPRWREAIRCAIDPRIEVHSGDVATVADVLETPGLKERAAREYDAVAVDMESAAVLAAALDAGVPGVVVRVVLDTATDALPEHARAWIDERGHRRLAPALAAALDPRQWRRLATLTQRFRAARRSLRMLAATLAPRDFLFPYEL
jgi:adenosylhomocysteine nucleosidase